MLSKGQIAAFHTLLNHIDEAEDSPFKDYVLNEERVKEQIDRIFANKDLEKSA
jgi:hypothetical protein